MRDIWLLDDSPTILMALERVLSKAGFAVQAFSTPRAALAALAGGPPSLIISDLNMPEMDGISFLREVRTRASCRFLPVLLLTTETRQEKREAARAAGAAGWLVKPVTAEQLLEVIKMVVKR